jgi:hypothetical protein
MSGTDNVTGAQPSWWHPTAALTPKGSAIAGFTLAGISLLGQSAWTVAAQALFWGSSWPQHTIPWVFLSAVLAPVLSAVLGMLLARRVLTGPAGDGWETHLARAAVVIAELGIVLGVVAAIGNLLLQH